MKKIILIFIFLSINISADVVMQKAEKKKPEISLPIEKPIRPVRPVINTGVVYQDNYYNETYTTNCNQYLEIIAQKDETIMALQKEIHALKSKEQQKLQQNLKTQYDAEMKKFENRSSSINTKNSAVISDRPID